MKRGVEVAGEEVEIFKYKQKAEADEQRQKKQRLSALSAFGLLDLDGAEVIDRDGGEHDGEIAHLAPGIKHEADEKQNKIFCFFGGDIVE